MLTSNKIALNFINAENSIPQGLKNIIKTVENKMKGHFNFKAPSDIEWRTYDHPDYQKDKEQNTREDDGGFITRDFKKIYINLNAFKGASYEEFVAHELGHIMDKQLGGGKYFSTQTKIETPLNSPPEAFAMMVAYVINEGHSGGATQTALYNAACDKLNIKDKVKPGTPFVQASRVIHKQIDENPLVFQIITAGYDRSLLKPGYKGKWLIHSHLADKAGRHFDLRLEFPVESLHKSLDHYMGKRNTKTEEPMERHPDEPGTVYRSFAVKKHKIPDKDKLFIIPTEDHPLEYGKFKGDISEGYGKGTVDIWDKGIYEILNVEGDKKYFLKFHGKKLNGIFALIKYNQGFLWIRSKDQKVYPC